MSGAATDRKETFGERLRRYRVAAGLSQEELAERAGLSAHGISDLERGARNHPYRDTIQRLAAALGLNSNETANLQGARRLEEASVLPVQSTRARLPEPLTSFVGRDQEVREVRELLRSGRLVTLTGVGGIGKTRLALELARHLEAEGRPVGFVDLTALGDPALVPQVVATHLEIPEQRGQPLVETLLDALRPRSLLLVLDNCEHLATACATLLARVLGACPNVRALATSREPLGILGEVTWSVLPLPQPPIERLPLAALAQVAAVGLFVDRAHARKPDFALTAQNADALVEVCRRLEGVPLAIELAAARVAVLEPEQIATRLDDCFRLLTQGSRVAPQRQQTLRATLDWSYELLLAQEKMLFNRLAVFAGGWTLEAAEAVCTGPPLHTSEILDLLGELVNKSLVLTQRQADGTMRYRLLETVRQYAAEHLETVGEHGVTMQRHAHYYLECAERIDVVRTVDWPRWRREGWAWLTTESDNLRAVIGRCRSDVVDRGAEEEVGLRVCASLWWFWNLHDRWEEASDGLSVQLASSPPRITPARFWCCWYAGIMAGAVLANFERSESLLAECREVARGLADRQLLALAQGAIGQDLLHKGRLSEAQAMLDHALALAREVGPTHYLQIFLLNSGWAALRAGRLEDASAFLEEAVAVASNLGDEFTLSFALPSRGTVAVLRGHLASAREFFQQAERLSASLPNRGMGMARIGLGRLALHEGDLEQAATVFLASLDEAVEVGRRVQVCESLEGLALFAKGRSDERSAVRLLAAVESARTSMYRGRPPDYRSRLQEALAALRTSLGTAEFELAWRAGQQLALDEAVVYAREIVAQSSPQGAQGTRHTSSASATRSAPASSILFASLTALG